MRLSDALPDVQEYAAATQAVYDALTIKGPSPEVTDAAYAKLKREWPTLGLALDRFTSIHRKVTT